MNLEKKVAAVFGLLVIAGVHLALAQTNAENPAREPAAAGLARDLIGEPNGKPMTGAQLDQATEEVASLLRCPVCQGLSVAASPTTSALAMREETRDLLRLGYSEDQILAYFERSYGEFIRLSPKPEGFNLVVWLLPLMGLLAGALVIGGRLRRRGRSGGLAEGSMRKTETGESGDSGQLRPREAGIPDELAAYTDRVRREVAE